jgi:hypothetical protein
MNANSSKRPSRKAALDGEKKRRKTDDANNTTIEDEDRKPAAKTNNPNAKGRQSEEDEGEMKSDDDDDHDDDADNATKPSTKQSRDKMKQDLGLKKFGNVPLRKHDCVGHEAAATKFWKYIEDMNTDAEVHVFIDLETAKWSRTALFGGRNQGLEKAVTHVVKLENERRRKENERRRRLSVEEGLDIEMLDEIQSLSLGVDELEKMTCKLPATPDPLPPEFSRVDHVLEHLATLKKSRSYIFAVHLEELIQQYYKSVENILHVPRPTKNSTKAQDMANNWRRDWDSVSSDGSTKGTTLNWWKKQILIYLGFVSDLKKEGYHLIYVRELMEFREMHGHCYPPKHSHQNLFNFLRKIRSGKLTVDQEIEDELVAIGWDRNADPAVERSITRVTARDGVMIEKIEEFYRKSSPNQDERHTFVPHPMRANGNSDLERLYFWIQDVRSRYRSRNNPEVVPLAKDVEERLGRINFVLNPIGHYGINKRESRHYLAVDTAWDRINNLSNTGVTWNVEDEPHTDGDQRRPDRVMYQLGEGGQKLRVVISEFDEAGHVDRSIESEQKKLYHQCIHFIHTHNAQDIQIIRVDGGHSPFPSEAQAERTALIIKDILEKPFPKEPTVTVTLLDFDRKENRHVQEYQARIIPSITKTRATVEGEWKTKPMYDKVVMYWTNK